MGDMELESLDLVMAMKSSTQMKRKARSPSSPISQ